MNNPVEKQTQSAKMRNGPMSRLILYTEELTRIIREEIVILETRRPSEIGPLQVEKERLSSIYEEEYAALKKDKSFLGGKDSPLRAQLRGVTETFNSELVKLGRILLRMKSVTEGMVQAVGDEVAKKRQSVRNYSLDAEITISQTTKPVPIALNEVI